MRGQIYHMFCTSLLLLFVCSVAESKIAFFKLYGQSYNFVHESQDRDLNYSLKATLTGCEDYGGSKGCQEKGEFFTCINDEQDVSKYRCECRTGYKIVKEKCVAKTGCEDFGGNSKCENLGPFWKCVNGDKDVSKYGCDCVPGYKRNGSECLAKTGCEDFGGNSICENEGPYWTCVNDVKEVSKYRCDCVPGYKRNGSRCFAETGCEDFGGNFECENRGPFWICANDEKNVAKYRCDCKLGYKMMGNKCVAKECNCGYNSYACRRDENGAQLCSCFPGYAQLGDICSECYCGENTASCFFDRNEMKFCICQHGYAHNNGTCSKICTSSSDCLNEGVCSSDRYEYFCKCKSPYTGDRCETNEVCERIKDTCRSFGAVCYYIHSKRQGFCTCPPSKIFNAESKRCENKLKIKSIFFIILCLASVFLLCSIVAIIILLKKFRKKFQSLNVKAP